MKKELIEFRKSNQKHFLNEDGTIEAIIYNDDVHYLKDGVYEEINNTLVEENNRYHIVGNDFDLSFSKECDSELLEINKSNHYLKMSLKDAYNVSNKELKKDNKIRKKGSISYDNIYNNIDLNYQILPKKIKETIVIKDKDSIKDKFVFDIKTDLELKVVNNKIVSDKFTILDSFMIDSNKALNKEIYYVLNKIDGGYELVLVLDRVWLECEDRIYPVYIDPTITTEELSNSSDTYISSKYPDTNFGSSEILKASVSSTDEVCRSLIKFELPVIATGSNVVNAKMYVYECPYEYFPGTYQDSYLTVHKITSNWSEDSATWDNMNDKYDKKVEDYIYSDRKVDITIFNANYVSFDITNLVKRWYAGSPNYGLMIKTHKEKFVENSLYHDFMSKDYSSSNNGPKPILTVTYRNKNGLEPYLTYQNQFLSNGNIYENNYNGNVTIGFNVGGTVGGKMPMSLKLFYNTNDVILNKNYGFGIGVQLNIHQIVKQSNLAQSDVNLYEYIDEDGTVHYFVPKNENNEIISNTFIDEDGLSLSLVTSSEMCKIIDKFGNYKIFTKIGNVYYLTKICDLKNNEIVISYTDSKITSIVDANGKQITITYQDNNIIIASPLDTYTLTLNNGKLTNIINNFGEVVINYNSNNIINFIIDINGKKYGFDYYEMIPYRVKKVSEYSTNDVVGQTLNFDYGFEVTQVTNNKGICNTYTFNEFGNTISTSNLGIGQNINESYGKSVDYGLYEKNINKLIAKGEKVKAINNLIWNSSFEKDYNIFKSNDSLEVAITNEFSLDGNRSLKLSGYGNAWASIKVEESGSYTFSFYSKAYNEFRIWLQSSDKFSDTLLIEPSIEFERHEITIDNVEAQSNIEICFYLGGLLISNVYIDNIQLEKGKVANYYNLIDNNDFKYNMAGWIYDDNDEYIESTPTDNIAYKTLDNRSDEIITYEDGSRAFKMICDPSISRGITRFIDVSGSEGDMLYFSFWYKNSGLAMKEILPESHNNTVQFILWPKRADSGSDGYFIYANLNTNSDEWQYYSMVIKAPYDYSKFRMILMSDFSANELYVTNFNLIRVDGLLYNSYDESGNLIATYDKSNNESTFKYDPNNQLIKMTNPIGNSLSYEYDNNISNRILSGISSTGVTNSIKYDENGNPIVTKISNKTKLNLETGNYYIRAKGTNKYLKYDSLTKKLIIKEDACSHAKWNIIVDNNNLTFASLLQNIVYLEKSEIGSVVFNFEKQDNESFILKTNNKYLTVSSDNLILSDVIDIDNQQFYFEMVDPLYIEFTAEYSTDGRFLTKTIDTLFNEISYDVNESNGLINKITDSLENVTNYNYNEKQQVASMTRGSAIVKYNYINNNNLLSKIEIVNNKKYTFNYNDYLKVNSVYMNDIKLIENIYEENNGNLLKNKYGNGDEISYEYDEFERISKLIKINDIFNYFYDNFSNIKRIESNEIVYSYYYDLAQRLINYKENDNYKIDYNYNKSNNLISKSITLDKNVNNYTYEYNEEENIIKLTNDNIVVNYLYDELQRLIQININDYIINYKYVTNGRRTSTLIDSISYNDDTYKYKYDKLNNIKTIYKNDNLIKSYYYDINSELIKEITVDGYVEYTYDDFGNLLTKTIYNTNNEIINSFVYEYNNTNFKDQLTKYNDTIITYDEIGNPLTIGQDTLTWTNGRQLVSYSNDNRNITYKYNKDGIRIEKKVGDAIYKYYLEGNAINYIQNEENMLYFIRELDDSLIAFKYNSDIYYYVKNAQDDIIGIKDTNLNIIAKYEYDSFGKILSIKDENEIEITDTSHIAHINPFRYRSYYYDTETNLYYLNSRYYNPEWGRFINTDNYISTDTGILGYNMYSYCNNNFINYVDKSGNFWLIATLIGAIATTAIVYNNKKQNKKAANEIRAVQEKYPNSCPNPIKSMEFEETLKENAKKVIEETKNTGFIKKNDYFLKNACDSCAFDLKSKEEWKNQTIYHDGHVMEAQDLGNYHFGYIARAAGLSYFNLDLGSSINQITKMNSEVLNNCFTTSFCDDPRDKYYIKLGAMAYDESLR